MTYLQWLQRYVELAIGDGTSTADTAAPAARGWPTPGATGSPRCSSAPRPACTRRTSGRSTRCSTKRCWRSRRRRSPRCWAATPTPTPSSCTRPMCRSSFSCARRWASRSTSCRSSTRTCGAGGAATRCGRPTTRATPPIRCASFRAPSPSPASPRSTSRWASCSTASSRRPSTTCWHRRTARRRGHPPPGKRRRHRPAGRRARRARRAVGRPHLHQPGAPDRRAAKWQVNQNRSATHHPRVPGWSCPTTTPSR